MHGMDQLKNYCEIKGFPFTVDTKKVMKETVLIWGKQLVLLIYRRSGRSLIEFVETHKVPILKKFGWYLDLRKRDRINLFQTG